MNINPVTSASYQNKANLQNFKAIPAAKAQCIVDGKKDTITIYEIEPWRDLPFLKKMMKKINLPKLKDCYEEKEYNKWKKMIDGAVKMADAGSLTFLAAVKNIPCGIMTVESGYLAYELFVVHRLAAWPTKYGETIKDVGTALIRHSIQEAKKNKAVSIELEPLTGGPGRLQTFYDKMHFEKTDSGKRFLTCDDFKKVSDYLDKKVNYETLHDERSIDLNKKLKLNYEGIKNGNKSC